MTVDTAENFYQTEFNTIQYHENCLETYGAQFSAMMRNLGIHQDRFDQMLAHDFDNIDPDLRQCYAFLTTHTSILHLLERIQYSNDDDEYWYHTITVKIQRYEADLPPDFVNTVVQCMNYNRNLFQI